MPADEIVEVVARVAISAVAEVGAQLIFNRYVARYFHGVGRRAIAVSTLGKIRIPSSLRESPDGSKPRPKPSDWVALVAGILVWSGAAALTIWALL